MTLEEFAEVIELAALLLVDQLPIDELSEVTKQSQVIFVRYTYGFKLPSQAARRPVIQNTPRTEFFRHMYICSVLFAA